MSPHLGPFPAGPYEERFTLYPDAHDEAIDVALDGFGVLGTFVAVGVEGESLAAHVRSRLPEPAGARAGVSTPPMGDSVVVKVLASRVDTALELLRVSETVILTRQGGRFEIAVDRAPDRICRKSVVRPLAQIRVSTGRLTRYPGLRAVCRATAPPPRRRTRTPARPTSPRSSAMATASGKPSRELGR